MHLFKCGHGCCEECLKGITAKKKFMCPFCRQGSALIANFDYVVSLSLEARGIICINDNLPSPIKQINTYSEFMNEWRNEAVCALNKNHKFIALHNQIIAKEYERRRSIEIKTAMNKKLAEKIENKNKRAQSRDKAVCSICHKNTFTSLKQLNLHMNAKHANVLKIKKRGINSI
tara:strand:+ start:3362 stop:3883 length:522 start_codon:yes stop_codon:yes gene_type:complete